MTSLHSLIASLSQKQQAVVRGFFIVLLSVGLFIVRDYGVSTDEPQQHNVGMTSVRYVTEKFFPDFFHTHPQLQVATPLYEFWDRDYGVAFEMPLAWLDQVWGFESRREVIWFRHVCTFLLSVAGVGAVYQLAKRRFNSWHLGLLGALLLVLSPRIFAEMFYNCKDAAFMAVFAIATNTTVLFVERPSWRRAGWHALACACAVDVRIMGVLLPVATLGLVCLQTARGAYQGQRIILKVGAYLGLMSALIILLWPYLWESPVQHFLEAFRNMSKFRWNGELLYAGGIYTGDELPWHYALVWIGITTPIPYLLGFFVGVFLILRQLMRRRWHLYAAATEWQDLLFLSLTLAPLASVIVLHSVLYDGWRQLYFVYPSLLLVSLRGLVALWHWLSHRPKWQRLSYPALVTTLVVMAGQLVIMHPLQNTYFNLLPGRHIESRFEVDYWVLSYHKGLEWIVRHDKRPHIRVSGQQVREVEANCWMLSDYDQNRIEVVDNIHNADYYVTAHRVNESPARDSYADEVYSVRREGQRILSVFRVK
jgi:hypothetical protein